MGGKPPIKRKKDCGRTFLLYDEVKWALKEWDLRRLGGGGGAEKKKCKLCVKETMERDSVRSQIQVGFLQMLG